MLDVHLSGEWKPKYVVLCPRPTGVDINMVEQSIHWDGVHSSEGPGKGGVKLL